MPTTMSRLKAYFTKQSKKETRIPGVLTIWINPEGEHRWRLQGANGEIVCTGEAYTTQQHAVDSVATAARLLADPNLQVLRTGHPAPPGNVYGLDN